MMLSPNEYEISIVIVNYNNFNLLINCINSIIKFTTNISYEIIVIDNNSTEGDIEIVLREYKKIKLIKSNVNEGFAIANNKGIKAASGKYILILNNDTIFFENTLYKVHSFIQTQDKLTAVGCKLLNLDGSVQTSFFDFPDLLNIFSNTFFLHIFFPKIRRLNKFYLDQFNHTSPIEVDVVIGAFLFARTELFKTMNGFNEEFFFYAEEMDFCKRIQKFGGKIIYFPETAIIHYGGATSQNLTWFKFKNEALSTLRLYRIHFKKSQILIAYSLYYMSIFLRGIVFLFGGTLSFNKLRLKKSFLYFRQLFVHL